MESLDFVYDLTEKLEAQNMDYLVVAIRKGKEQDSADVFYKLRDDESVDILNTVLGNVDFIKNPLTSKKKPSKNKKKKD